MTDDEELALSLVNAYWVTIHGPVYPEKSFPPLPNSWHAGWLAVLSRARELLAPEPAPQDVEALAKWCRATLWDTSIGSEATDEFIKKNWCKLATALITRYGPPPKPAEATPPAEQRYVIRVQDSYSMGPSEGATNYVDPPATAAAPSPQPPASAAPELERWEAKRFPMSCIDPGWEPIADVTNSQMVLCKRRTGGTP